MCSTWIARCQGSQLANKKPHSLPSYSYCMQQRLAEQLFGFICTVVGHCLGPRCTLHPGHPLSGLQVSVTLKGQHHPCTNPELLQAKMESQLKPLFDLVTSLAAEAEATGYVPDFLSYGEWLRERERANAEASKAQVDLALPAAFGVQGGAQVELQDAGGGSGLDRHMSGLLRLPTMHGMCKGGRGVHCCTPVTLARMCVIMTSWKIAHALQHLLRFEQ